MSHFHENSEQIKNMKSSLPLKVISRDKAVISATVLIQQGSSEKTMSHKT